MASLYNRTTYGSRLKRGRSKSSTNASLSLARSSVARRGLLEACSEGRLISMSLRSWLNVALTSSKTSPPAKSPTRCTNEGMTMTSLSFQGVSTPSTISTLGNPFSGTSVFTTRLYSADTNCIFTCSGSLPFYIKRYSYLYSTCT